MHASLRQCLTLFTLTLAAVLTPSSDANAYEWGAGERLQLTQDAQDDYFGLAETVILSSGALADFTALAKEIRIEANVKGDARLLGETVIVEGDIADDAFIVAGTVLIKGNIGDDLHIAAGTIEIASTATIGGDIIIAGEDAFIEGKTVGDLTAFVSTLTLTGPVAGTVHLRTDTTKVASTVGGESVLVSRIIHLEDRAEFRSNIRWNAQNDAADFTAHMASGAVAIFDESFAQVQADDDDHDASFIGGVFLAFPFAFTMILLLTVIDATFFTAAAKRLLKTPWKAFFIGLAYFCFLPMLCVLLLLSVVGIPFAMMIGAAYVFSIVFSRAICAYALARAWTLHAGSTPSKWKMLFIAVAIWFALRIAAMIPLLGFLTTLAAACAGFGTILMIKAERVSKMR